MNALTRLLLRTLSRAGRPYLESVGLLRVKKIFNRSALEWNPGNERVVVLAPHMDDEVIGCGGTLARHIERGADITVVFLTDGRRGGKSSGDSAAADALAAQRKQESRRALAELGITHSVFLAGEDGGLRAGAALCTELRATLESARPQLIYLPSFLEEHPDHRAASALLAGAVAGSPLEFRCHAYEVWTPLFPNCFVRIDSTLEAKRRALLHYQSQLAEADYLHTGLGLNAYRSSALLDGGCRYAEAFLAVSSREYLELYREYADDPGASAAAGRP